MPINANVAKLTATAVKLARLANPDNNSNEAERDAATLKLAEHCSKHGLNVADIIALSQQPDAPAKRAPKPDAAKPTTDATPEPEAAKPSKPHAADAKRAEAHDEREALVAKLRATCAKLYNGPSLAVRSNPKRVAASVYADLLTAPKHRTTLQRVSERDESFLYTVIGNGGAGATFDPVNLNLDAGIFSRLASIAFIEAAPASAKLPYRLTKAGLAHANTSAKRAA